MTQNGTCAKGDIGSTNSRYTLRMWFITQKGWYMASKGEVYALPPCWCINYETTRMWPTGGLMGLATVGTSLADRASPGCGNLAPVVPSVSTASLVPSSKYS